MKYPGDISPEAYAAMEEGYEQGRAVAAKELAHARAEALRDFATEVCDRNGEFGYTEEARHFGRSYAKQLRATADRIEAEL